MFFNIFLYIFCHSCRSVYRLENETLIIKLQNKLYVIRNKWMRSCEMPCMRKEIRVDDYQPASRRDKTCKYVGSSNTLIIGRDQQLPIESL